MTQELSQISLVLLMSSAFITGFASGAFYDIFRIRRKACKRSKERKKLLTTLAESFIIGIEDVFFFLLLGCVTSVLFYVFNYGKVRLLALLAELLGFLLYRVSVGRFVMSVADGIIAFIRLIFHQLYKFVLCPIKNGIKKVFLYLTASHRRRCQKRRRKKYSSQIKKKLIKASKQGMLVDPGE